MVSGMRTGYHRGLNKGLGSKFRDGSRLRREVPDYDKKVPEPERVSESDKKYLKKVVGPKRCTDNNEDGDNSPNNADNTNHQASSQTFREIIYIYIRKNHHI